MIVLIERVNEIFSKDAALHMQAGDVSIETSTHLRACETTGGAELAGNETALLTKGEEDGLFDAALGRGGVAAATKVAEIGPPVETNEARLACEELAIHAMAIGNDGALPLQQGPVPSTMGKNNITTLIIDQLLGGIAGDAAIEQGQEAYLLDERHELRTGVNLRGNHFNASLIKRGV